MSEEKTALARRAVACPGWLWMPGMKIANGPRVIGDDPIEPDDTPDFDDPPTMGWLLALVREALGDPTAYVGHAGASSITPWWLMAPEPMTRAATEAEALVAALEAAGDKTERGRR
jgi:hypothetical protein